VLLRGVLPSAAASFVLNELQQHRGMAGRSGSAPGLIGGMEGTIRAEVRSAIHIAGPQKQYLSHAQTAVVHERESARSRVDAIVAKHWRTSGWVR